MKRRYEKRGLIRTWHIFGLWYQDNREIEHFLRGSNVSWIQVGYEELCFYPEAIVRMICGFLGVEFDEHMLVPANSQSHLGLGNSMASDPVKRKRVYYDNRWFFDHSVNLVYLLRPKVREYNERSVYHNTRAMSASPRFAPPAVPAASIEEVI